MAATYPADTFQEGVDLTIEASNQLAQVVRGDANTEITVADGSTIPSIRKAQADSMYFKEPELWTTGQSETDYLQLKKYTDPVTNKESWWFAKGALASNPIAMGTSPFGDENWFLYTPEDLFISGKAEYESIYQALKGKAAEAGYNLVRGSFEEGGTLTNTNDVLWYQANGKYYNWFNGSAKTVVAGSTPATSGGVGAGAWIDRTDVTLRDEIRETVFQTTKRSYAEAGYNLVDGSFETGGTLTAATDVLLQESTGVAYGWTGSLPKVVAPGFDPVGVVGFELRTDAVLRSELAGAIGSDLVGTSVPAHGSSTRTVRGRLQEFVFLGDFDGVDRTGATDSSAALRNAIAYAVNITETFGTDNAASKSVTINLGRGIIRIDSTVLVPRNIAITSDGATVVSDSNDFVFESGYMLNGALVSNMQLSDTEAIANRLVGTRLDNLTFYRCSRAIRMRAFNEQCGLQRLRFYQCGTAYAVYQSFYSNYKDIIIRQVKSGFDNLPAVVYGRASNRISTDEIYIAGRSKGIEFGEPGAFDVYGSASCQFSGLSLEVLNEGFKFIGKMRNISIIGTYIEQVSSVFFDTDGDVKHEITIKDSYSYSSAFYVDMSGLRDSFIGGVTDAADPVNKAVVQLREGSFGNTATVEVYGLDDGTTGNNRYRLSNDVRTTGALIKYTGGQYGVLKSQDFAEHPTTSTYAKQISVHDIGWYGVAQNFLIGAISGSMSGTSGTEMFALTNFFYSEYTALNYSIKVTPKQGSGAGGTTPAPIFLKGIAIGGHATQIVPNGMSVSSVRDNITGTVRLNFGPFGSSASDPAFAWMRNRLFTSEGIIKLIA